MTAVLSVRRLSKRFGAVPALVDVDLDFEAGEIHALLGENGAGKSTLMNVLSGLYRPDSGGVALDGRPVVFHSPRDARRAGIGMVHQHFTLVDALTVVENLALSLPGQSAWRFDAAAAARAAERVAQRVGLELGALHAPVSGLPVGARQRLEILKALAHAGHVLILDEPTAILTPREVRRLFVMLRELRQENRLVIFITHKLREVNDVADRVTIMRRGRVVGTYRTGELTESEMAQRMVGDLAPVVAGGVARTGKQPTALRVAGLCVSRAAGRVGLDNVNFEVCQGEIFGIAGVDGNGQRELFEVLVGLLAPEAGTVTVGGAPLTLCTPRAALAAGIGHIPPDRHREGLVLAMSVRENILLNRSVLDRCSRRGLLQPALTRQMATALAGDYAIRVADVDAPVRTLSGGNQQRLIVARELAEHPAVLITANPTRGLDIAATRMVAEALRNATRQGCAVVLISTDLDEVLDLSDRVGVLSRGRLSAPLQPPVDVEQLGLLMAGAD